MNWKNILITASCFLGACSGNSKQSNNNTIIDQNITQGKPLPPKEWHCYNVDEDKICIPEGWGYVKQNSIYFLSDLSRLESNSYFVVGKYDKKTTGLDAIKYLKNQYAEFKENSTQLLTASKVVKIIFTEKEMYSSEFNLTIDKKPYIVYSTVFEIGNDLYDMSLRTSVAKSKSYLEAYQNITSNFYHNDTLVFTIKDKIVNAEVIDVTKL